MSFIPQILIIFKAKFFLFSPVQTLSSLSSQLQRDFIFVFIFDLPDKISHCQSEQTKIVNDAKEVSPLLFVFLCFVFYFAQTMGLADIGSYSNMMTTRVCCVQQLFQLWVTWTQVFGHITQLSSALQFKL